MPTGPGHTGWQQIKNEFMICGTVATICSADFLLFRLQSVGDNSINLMERLLIALHKVILYMRR